MASFNRINITSEISELQRVIVHTPGQELENMTPQNAERALYSDILNLNKALKEFAQFKGVMEKHAQVFELKDLLSDILSDSDVKKELIGKVVPNNIELGEYLSSMDEQKLSRSLIEGVLMEKNTLTKYFSDERYSLLPLHNLFFMRDASMAINDKVLIGTMANRVRARESIIMDAIFSNHKELKCNVYNSALYGVTNSDITIEGGDVIVVRDDILLIGTGMRTSSQGIDFILDKFCNSDNIKHIIVQELPHRPESFIHLDMVFTLLDYDKCMVYEPFILKPNKYRTVHIKKDGSKISIDTKDNILSVLSELGIDMKALSCGGNAEQWVQEREQWHSGANFFAFTPGKLIGYGRNQYTVEEMNKNGFDILPAKDIIAGKIDLGIYKKYMVTIDGAELARGGGGARCMSMPINRI